MNYYPFHIGDYISHTNHLTDEEDLTYRRLIDFYYLSEKPLPCDLGFLTRKVKSNIDVVDLLLNEFFEFNPEDQCWHNKRIDQEIAKYRNYSISGKKGAEIRRLNREATKGVSTSPLATNNQEPRTNNHKPIVKTISAPNGVSDSVFKDYIQLRNKLKAPVTETAIKGLIKEAEKAGMTLESVMVLCCQNGWRGFKADWVKDKSYANQNKERNQSVLSGLTRGLIGSDKNVGLLGE